MARMSSSGSRNMPRRNRFSVTSRKKRSRMLSHDELGVRRRAEFYYQQLDALAILRQQVRRDLLAESKKHKVDCPTRTIRSSKSESMNDSKTPRIFGSRYSSRWSSNVASAAMNCFT
jgi:hypothetical protein